MSRETYDTHDTRDAHDTGHNVDTHEMPPFTCGHRSNHEVRSGPNIFSFKFLHPSEFTQHASMERETLIISIFLLIFFGAVAYYVIHVNAMLAERKKDQKPKKTKKGQKQSWSIGD